MALRDVYVRAEYGYDAAGNRNLEKYFGADGEPVLSNGGYARIEKVFDENKWVIEERYYGTDGEPVLSAAGYARVEREYDAEGKITAGH